jgi:tetratricopeptide (TPR) repeat protein
MFRPFFIALLLWSVAPGIYAQIVDLKLKDGGTIAGQLKGYEDGFYHLMVDGDLRKVADSDVTDVVIVGEKYERARALILEGKFKQASALIDEYLKTNPKDKFALELRQELEFARLKRDLAEARGIDEKIKILSKTAATTRNLEVIKWVQQRLDEIDTLRREEEFKQLKARLDSAKDVDEKIQILSEYIAKVRDEERIRWARGQLERLKPVHPLAGVQGGHIYFPVKAGLWYKYRKGKFGATEIIRITSVVEEGGMRKIFISRDQAYRTHVTSRQLTTLEMDSRALYKPYPGGKEVVLKFPINVGEVWSWKDKDIEFTKTYKSVTQSVKTPAGEFKNCLLVEFKTTRRLKDAPPLTMISHSFYAPKVGLVKLIMLDDRYSDYNLELVDYGIEK